MKHISLLLFFLFFLSTTSVCGYSDHRDRAIDSLEQVLRHEKSLEWEDRVRAHSDLMWGYLQTDSKKMHLHANAILQMTEGMDNGLIARSGAFRLIGQSAYVECLYDSARHCYERSEEVIDQMRKNKRYTKFDVDDAASTLYGTIGNLYNIQSMSTLALEYYLKALKIFEEYGWHESEAILYYNVGEMFLEMSNNEEAHKYYLLSEKAASLTQDSLIQMLPVSGLAMSLLNMGQNDEAMKAAKTALNYYLNHIDEEFSSAFSVYICMARIAYLGYGDAVLAQQYMDQAEPFIQRFEGDNTDVSDFYAFQAELCMARKEWQNVVDFGLKSLEENDEDLHHNIGVYQRLSVAYAHLGMADEAEHYTHLMQDAYDTFANQQHQSALGEMQVMYETQKKEARIAEMEITQRMTNIIYMAVIVGLLLLAVSLFTYFIYRRKVQLMKAKLMGEHDERQRLARDLHDRLGGMLTATRLSLESGNTLETSQLLQQTHAEMRKVAHHLMPLSLSRDGLDAAISEYCQVLPRVDCEILGTPVRFDAHLEILVYCVLHELINNALKHARAHHVQVQVMFEEHNVAAIIADDGVGFDVEAATQNQGSGLANIQERLKTVNSLMNITSNPGKGTEIYLTVPF